MARVEVILIPDLVNDVSPVWLNHQLVADHGRMVAIPRRGVLPHLTPPALSGQRRPDVLDQELGIEPIACAIPVEREVALPQPGAKRGNDDEASRVGHVNQAIEVRLDLFVQAVRRALGEWAGMRENGKIHPQRHESVEVSLVNRRTDGSVTEKLRAVEIGNDDPLPQVRPAQLRPSRPQVDRAGHDDPRTSNQTHREDPSHKTQDLIPPPAGQLRPFQHAEMVLRKTMQCRDARRHSIAYPRTMNRLERVRQIVDEILHRISDSEDRRCGFVHLYGVSLTAALLARTRGLDAELAGAAGMLHDLVTYESDDPTDHGPRSAERAAGILREAGGFSEAEITMIQSGIAHHSDKAGAHGAFEELLKDADVLQHYLYNPGLETDPQHRERRRRLMQALPKVG